MTEKNGCIASFQGQQIVPARKMAELERENARLREILDPDRLISACVPGGDICDPQQIADAVRGYLSNAPHHQQPEGQP